MTESGEHSPSDAGRRRLDEADVDLEPLGDDDEFADPASDEDEYDDVDPEAAADAPVVERGSAEAEDAITYELD